MRKNIYIIRHAKTKNIKHFSSDFERSLTTTGIADAHLIGSRLNSLNLKPSMVIASPSERMKQTAGIISGEIDFPVDSIIWVKELYQPHAKEIEKVIAQYAADNDSETIFVVTHNSGITEYVNEKIEHFKIAKVPTAGVVAYTQHLEDWSRDSLKEKGTFIYYDYPRNV